MTHWLSSWSNNSLQAWRPLRALQKQNKRHLFSWMSISQWLHHFSSLGYKAKKKKKYFSSFQPYLEPETNRELRLSFGVYGIISEIHFIFDSLVVAPGYAAWGLLKVLFCFPLLDKGGHKKNTAAFKCVSFQFAIEMKSQLPVKDSFCPNLFSTEN